MVLLKHGQQAQDGGFVHAECLRDLGQRRAAGHDLVENAQPTVQTLAHATPPRSSAEPTGACSGSAEIPEMIEFIRSSPSAGPPRSAPIPASAAPTTGVPDIRA